MNYQDFLKTKQKTIINSGFEIDENDIHKKLFPFQNAIVKWAIAKGRAAVFADTGLGKTIIQCEWARQIFLEKGCNILIIAPLAVAHQTVREAKKLLGVEIKYCREQSQVSDYFGITITNYEMLDKFDIDQFDGIVLDESSILKSKTGKYRTQLIERCRNVPYKLSCTATPSPNDFTELGNQSDFLGIMNQSEMLAMFFTLDSTPTKTGQGTSTWRLKGHGKKRFYEWLAIWACVIRKPSDLGFDDEDYNLPGLNIIDHVVESPVKFGLFATQAMTLSERRMAKRETMELRCQMAADLVNESNEMWIVWCHLNDEQALLNKMINRDLCVSVQGSDKDENKEDRMIGFSDGKYKVLISKPSIAGFGMNFQLAHNMVFVGMDDSFEKFYQAVRREYRFGQKHIVNAHIITAESEGAVKANIQRKQNQHNELSESMIGHMKKIMQENILGTVQKTDGYNPNEVMELPKFIANG